MSLTLKHKENLNTVLEQSGMRSTKHREQVFEVLLDQRDHPTADEIYNRVKAKTPTVSLATVYNCLETLVNCGLVKKLNYEREPSRFCPNEGDHAHFLDTESGKVFDIPLPDDILYQLSPLLPSGFEAEKIKLSFAGKAPATLINQTDSIHHTPL
jgi:Fur family peroxide stress response transcriptional regulator